MTTSLPRLGADCLPAGDHFLPGAWAEPAIGIVHLGLGNFHRAHQALYTEQAMLQAGGDWGICGVSLQGNAGLQGALAQQDHLYTVLTSDRDGQQATVVRALREVLVAPAQRAQVLHRMRERRVRIVALTITEKGYCHDPRTGGLDFTHPAIAHDLQNPDTPTTAVGYIVAALRARQDEPFTVLSCDNLAHNGRVLRTLVVQYADAIDPALGRWVAESVSFPSSMVDRIVPATTDETRSAVAGLIGRDDACPVPAEAFHQWVIEDDFPAGRPAWEQAGAMLVGDVAPYERAKLRMLNGSHSTLAYLGVLAGFETVDAAIADPAMRRLIGGMMQDEIAPTLAMPVGFDTAAYRDQLLTRFANPALRHKTMQIASDGSLKLPPRLLGVIAERRDAGMPSPRATLAVATWMRFLLRTTDAGARFEISDPMAQRLVALADASGGDNARLMASLLAVREIFPASLAERAAFRESLFAALETLQRHGAREAIRRYAA